MNDQDEVTPFVFGGAPFRRPTVTSSAAWAAVLLALVLPARGLFRYAGSLMEEGFMLVFPRLVRQGKVPNVDFLHLYGPGALDVLAAWLWLFDESLASERAFGFGQIIVAVIAITVAMRPWGWQAALPAGGTMTVLMITPTGFSALAWPGALALSLVSLLFGVRALHVEGRQRRVITIVAGVLAGFALTFRPDLVLALGMAWGVLLWQRVKLTDALIGAMIGAIPMWVHLAVAGIGPSWQGMVAEPVFDLRPGRRLPVPPTWGELDGALQALSENPVESPWWGLPSLGASQQLFFWFFALMITAIGSVVFGVWRWRRDGATQRIVWYTVLALFGLGLIGQAVQRPDSTHLAWGSSVAFSMLAATFVEVRSMIRTTHTIDALERAPQRVGWMVAPTAVVLAVLLFACPFFTFRPYLYLSRVSVGNLPSPGLPVRNGDLHFYLLNPEVQLAAQQAVDLVDAQAEPGERLLVGLADMRRTVYSDVIFYYLLPQLEPATQFIEMDPGIADAPGSSLAADVASADWLILTNFWTGWYEPNASTEEGSSAPNQAVADGFCQVGNFSNGLVMVFEQCADPDGVDPATIGVGPERRQSMLDEKTRRGG
ncbi:MAG TPA: hypothetical protein VMM60_04475 [Ilumatobacter sp.]|nr:hypothetical protein [Ilumatobacter sp.]